MSSTSVRSGLGLSGPCALIPICQHPFYKFALAVVLDVDQTCQQCRERLDQIHHRSKGTRISWYYAEEATVPGQGSKAAHRVDRKFQIVSGFLLNSGGILAAFLAVASPDGICSCCVHQGRANWGGGCRSGRPDLPGCVSAWNKPFGSR